MIITAEILFEVDEEYLKFLKKNGDKRNSPQVVLDLIKEELADRGIRIILAEAKEA